MQVLSTLIEWIRIGRLSEQEKDLEILVLRKQLAIVEQQLDKPVRLSRAERLTLAVISAKLKAVSGNSLKQILDVSRRVQPETVLKWHRELVRRKWTHKRKQAGGRPNLRAHERDRGNHRGHKKGPTKGFGRRRNHGRIPQGRGSRHNPCETRQENRQKQAVSRTRVNSSRP